MIMTKICFRCELELDISNFYHSQRNRDGYANVCKKCWNIRRNKNERLVDFQYTYGDEVKEIMKALGYDTETSIHEQFKKKHNL